MISKIYQKSSLPNQKGFKFLALISSNEGDYFYPAEIIKDEKTGLHSIYTENNTPYSSILGWLKMDKDGFPIYIK